MEVEYVFIASYGYHGIRIRTLDREYQLDSILLKQGMKLDLAVDINNLSKNVKATKMTEQLTGQERVAVKNSVISIYDNPGAENYLWQDNKVVVFCKDKRYQGSSSLNRFCGFFPRNTIFAVQNEFVQSFQFEPGFSYRISNGVVKMISNTTFNDPIILRGIYNPLSGILKEVGER